MSEIIKPYVEEVIRMNLKTKPQIVRYVENWLSQQGLLKERWDADGVRHWRLWFKDGDSADRFLKAYRDILRICKGTHGETRVL